MERKTVSGSMLALLLISMLTLTFNIQPTKADQESQLLLETDKDTYMISEDVTIVLTNIGVETIWIMGYPAYQIYTYPKDEPVYPNIFLTLLWSLEPGENDTFVWNQYNAFTHTPVEPGMYVIRDNQGWGLSVYFEIVALKEANIVRAWARFHHFSLSLGEPQTLYANVTNIGTKNVWVKVCFEMVTDGEVKQLETGVKRIPSNPHHNFKILKVEWMPTLPDVGKYNVVTTCYYDADCDHIPEVMDGTKIFSFAVFP